MNAKTSSLGSRDLAKLERMGIQRRTGVVNRDTIVQKGSNLDIGKRMTFFGETSEALMNSQSKKKIFFLYD